MAKRKQKAPDLLNFIKFIDASWVKGALFGAAASFALSFGAFGLPTCDLCHFPGASPEGVDFLPKSHLKLRKTGFIADYDGRLKQPSWTFHTLTREGLQAENALSREEASFQEDESLPIEMRSCLADFKGSGFDRGHIVSARDLSSNEEAFKESFQLSNISPQNPELNRGLLASLEKHARKLADRFGTVQVISGPLFLPEKNKDGRFRVSYQVIGKNQVAVPTHFFKIIKTPLYEEAYILPNRPYNPNHSFENFKVAKETVVKAAGISFEPSYTEND